jgi:murein DD-endopeptidase MepM/ murein hydrolase activator NlpD
MDFSANIGTDIYATGDGKVIKAERTSGGYGNMVLIDHGFGIQTLYGHMNTIGVLPGSEVRRGQVIGTVGNTGRSAGPHLHYEVLINGRHVNPINYFHNDLSPDEYVRLVEQSQENDIMEKW